MTPRWVEVKIDDENLTRKTIEKFRTVIVELV